MSKSMSKSMSTNHISPAKANSQQLTPNPLKFPNQPFILLLNRNGLMGDAVEAGEDAEAGGFYGVGLEIAQSLYHFEAFVPDSDDFGLADELVVEFHGGGEVQFYMHQNQIDGFPIDLVL